HHRPDSFLLNCCMAKGGHGLVPWPRGHRGNRRSCSGSSRRLADFSCQRHERHHELLPHRYTQAPFLSTDRQHARTDTPRSSADESSRSVRALASSALLLRLVVFVRFTARRVADVSHRRPTLLPTSASCARLRAGLESGGALMLSPIHLACNASLQAFVNCYLREIDAGTWYPVEDFKERSGIPFGRGERYVVEIQLPHQGRVLAIGVSYRSLVG